MEFKFKYATEKKAKQSVGFDISPIFTRITFEIFWNQRAGNAEVVKFLSTQHEQERSQTW